MYMKKIILTVPALADNKQKAVSNTFFNNKIYNKNNGYGKQIFINENIIKIIPILF